MEKLLKPFLGNKVLTILTILTTIVQLLSKIVEKYIPNLINKLEDQKLPVTCFLIKFIKKHSQKENNYAFYKSLIIGLIFYFTMISFYFCIIFTSFFINNCTFLKKFTLPTFFQELLFLPLIILVSSIILTWTINYIKRCLLLINKELYNWLNDEMIPYSWWFSVIITSLLSTIMIIFFLDDKFLSIKFISFTESVIILSIYYFLIYKKFIKNLKKSDVFRFIFNKLKNL